MSVLLIEEDGTCNANDEVQKGLKQKGYIVERVRDGKLPIDYIKTKKIEVILLDLSLSQISGPRIVCEIRDQGIKTPILILNSSPSIKDKVQAFDSGADDYLKKPVDLDELFARIRALLRRDLDKQNSPLLTHGDIELDPSSHSVTFKGQPIHLPRREFSLLHILLKNPGHIVSYGTVNHNIYGWSKNIKSNALEVHVYRLRKKFSNPQLIRTIRGIGYMLVK